MSLTAAEIKTLVAELQTRTAGEVVERLESDVIELEDVFAVIKQLASPLRQAVLGKLEEFLVSELGDAMDTPAKREYSRAEANATLKDIFNSASDDTAVAELNKFVKETQELALLAHFCVEMLGEKAHPLSRALVHQMAILSNEQYGTAAGLVDATLNAAAEAFPAPENPFVPKKRVVRGAAPKA